MKALCLLLLLAAVTAAQIKKPEPPAVKTPFAESLQVIVVTTKHWTETKGEARLYERKDEKSKWRAVSKEFDIVVGRSGLGWDNESARKGILNNAPTLSPVFTAYCSAWVKKDETGLRKVYSAETIRDFERQMNEDNIKTLVEFLSEEQLSNEFCAAHNENISGNIATAEVRSKGYPSGITVVFVNENGEWKMTNRRPERYLSSALGNKKEGDGKSPAGMFPLTFAFGKPDSFDSKLSYQRLTEFTECVDDVNSTFYNRIAHRLQVGNFDWKSSEKMVSITPEYDLGVFVAYNSYPVVKGNGSCIFLHIWKDANTPTSGCTAMAREDMERVVAWLDAKKKPYLVQLPEVQYEAYRKPWNLPKHN